MAADPKKTEAKKKEPHCQAFANIRSTASRKKWDHTFVTSRSAKGERFLSLFIETPAGEFIEAHGKIEDASEEMRREAIRVGLMQSRPGAPSGNANARAENRKKDEPPKNDLRRGSRA